MSPQDKLVCVVLHHRCGLGYREIARLLDRSDKTIKAAIASAEENQELLVSPDIEAKIAEIEGLLKWVDEGRQRRYFQRWLKLVD